MFSDTRRKRSQVMFGRVGLEPILDAKARLGGIK